MSNPIFKQRWRSACVEFPAVGEVVTIPNIKTSRRTFRQSKVAVMFDVYDGAEDEGDFGASGHAGNGLWWTAPAALFTIGGARMEPHDAEQLAKWILMMVGKPVKDEKAGNDGDD